jgi:hypothetical protein
MADIVERLCTPHRYDLMDEAANEIERLRAEIERLRAALQRIDGINDNPAIFNPMIEEVLRAALEPKP